MRKLFILGAVTLSAIQLFSQVLLSKIPQNANVVATFNTGKLLQLVPAEEWNSSNLGKKLLQLGSRDSSERLNSVNDIGINLAGTIYFFHTENDSVHYNYIMAPLADAVKFDALFKNNPFIKLDNNTRLLAEPDSTGFMIWDNQQFLYARGFLKDFYFDRPDIAKRYGLPDHSFYFDSTARVDSGYVQGMDDRDQVVDSALVITEPSPPEPIKTKPAKAVKPKTLKKTVPLIKKGSKSKPVKKTKPKPLKEEESQAATELPDETRPATESVDTAAFPPPPYQEYDKEFMIKKRLAAAFTQTALRDLFKNTPAHSIAENAQYMKSLDDKAVASLWVDRPMDLYQNLVPRNLLYGRALGSSLSSPVNATWYKSFAAKIFLDEKQMRLSSSAELTDEMADLQQKFLNRKLNKKFLDYINTDSLLGYLSWAMDTRAYLENFPKMLESAYGAMVPGLGSDEYPVLVELISFLLDEEAVSQLVKGDGMIVFNGLYQQQTTYTDYVYDENYKATAVEKSKTDTLPRFLLMISSDENNFERKLVSYGIKKEVVKQRDGFFEISIPKSPVSLYFLNKDGIFFLANSLAEIQNISAGKYLPVISKQEKNFLLSHNYTLFINPAKIAGQIATTEIGAAESLSSAIRTFGKMGTVRAVMNPLQATTLSGDLVMEVPPDNRNALKYIFEIFDGFIK